jgi:hypothetical protein
MTRLLAVLCGLALVAGGCGSEDQEDPGAALDAAAKKTAASESNRQEFSVVSDLDGSEFTMNGEGTFSADSTRGRMTFEMDAEGFQGPFEAITDGRVTYLKGDQLPLPPGKEWVKTLAAPSSALSPREFVDFLRDSGEVDNEGTEEIRSEETTHYRGSVNLRELAEASRSELLRRLNQASDVDALDTTIDIWVRQDGLLARLALEVRPPQDEVSGSVKVTTDILEYDVEVDAEPPPASKVVEG